MLLNEILGWLGNICFIVGCTWLARKNNKGFYANILGNLFYGVQAIAMNNISLIMLSIFLGIINAYGIWNWHKNDK